MTVFTKAKVLGAVERLVGYLIDSMPFVVFVYYIGKYDRFSEVPWGWAAAWYIGVSGVSGLVGGISTDIFKLINPAPKAA